MEPFGSISSKINAWARRYGCTPMLLWLIGINLAVFMLYSIIDKGMLLFGRPTDVPFRLLAMPTDFERLLHAPWTLLTSTFFHEGLWHILFNMLWLWFFGRLFSQYFSSNDLLLVYLLGGATGNLLCVVAYEVLPYFHNAAAHSYILGASGAAMAIMLATTMKAPRAKIYLWGLLELEVRYFALIIVAIDFFSVAGENAGGHIAHIGGALFGLLYSPLRRRAHLAFQKHSARKRPYAPRASWHESIHTRKQRRAKSTNRTAPQGATDTRGDGERLKEILEKLSKGGYGALSTEEKEFLFRRKG